MEANDWAYTQWSEDKKQPSKPALFIDDLPSWLHDNGWKVLFENDRLVVAIDETNRRWRLVGWTHV